MRVEEAKTKICPFMSTDNGEYDYVKCKTSECMAWVTTKTIHDTLTDKIAVDNGNGTMSVKNVPMQLEHKDQEGYCKRIGQ